MKRIKKKIRDELRTVVRATVEDFSAETLEENFLKIRRERKLIFQSILPIKFLLYKE